MKIRTKICKVNIHEQKLSHLFNIVGAVVKFWSQIS